MSLNDWLVAGLRLRSSKVLKRLPGDPDRLLAQLLRWRDEAVAAGRRIEWGAITPASKSR